MCADGLVTKFLGDVQAYKVRIAVSLTEAVSDGNLTELDCQQSKGNTMIVSRIGISNGGISNKVVFLVTFYEAWMCLR